MDLNITDALVQWSCYRTDKKKKQPTSKEELRNVLEKPRELFLKSNTQRS